MKKSDLIRKLSERMEISVDKAGLVTRTILEAFISAMEKGDRIEIRNFGNFTIRTKKAYKGRNPKTGELVDVPSTRNPHFKPGEGLKKMVNGWNTDN